MECLTRQVCDTTVVMTAEGRMRGVNVNGISCFRGVPYAVSRRFEKARPCDRWDGIRDTVKFAPVCPLPGIVYPRDAYRVPHYYRPVSEDCLSLNIWTPAPDGNRRPVMVWLHGGGWSGGHAMEITSCDGEELCRAGDVVVVSVNHRLDVFGYLDLTGQSEKYAESGCLGMLDIVEALRWIQRNIAAFGGDPDRVTLFGQSCGGDKITCLMQMPAADGLYHRAILESGGVGFRARKPEAIREDAATYTGILFERLRKNGYGEKDINDLPWQELALASSEAKYIFRERFGRSYRFEPVPDRINYTGHPLFTGFRQETGNIPMLIGCCYSEHSNNFDDPLGEGHKNSWTEEYTLRLIRDVTGENADECIAAFRYAYPERPLQDMLFMSRATRAAHAEFCRKRAASVPGKVWNWIFALEAPFMGGTLPWHNAEEPYVFRNAAYSESQYEPGVSEKVEEDMSGAWVEFARSGDPNREGYPDWPSVTCGTLPTRLFDRVPRTAFDHDRRLLEVFTAPEVRGTRYGTNVSADGLAPRQ